MVLSAQSQFLVMPLVLIPCAPTTPILFSYDQPEMCFHHL